MHRTKTKDLSIANKAMGIVIAIILGVTLTGGTFAEAEEREELRCTLIEQLALTAYRATENIIRITDIADDIDASPAQVEAEKEDVAADDAAYEVEIEPVDEPTTQIEPVSVQTTYIESEPTVSVSYDDSMWFKRMGVIDEAGWHYTYYSSNKRRHRDTDQWVLGDDLIWRTTDGYVVVACVADKQGNSVARGTIVPTPFGSGKVLDSGCAAGTIDIYVGY